MPKKDDAKNKTVIKVLMKAPVKIDFRIGFLIIIGFLTTSWFSMGFCMALAKLLTERS